MPKSTVEYKAWVAELETRFGADQIRYREVGEHGWSRLVSTDEGQPAMQHHNDGPHWIDAAPRFREHRLSGRLFGNFNFNENIGKIYFEK